MMKTDLLERLRKRVAYLEPVIHQLPDWTLLAEAEEAIKQLQPETMAPCPLRASGIACFCPT
jgi:16S rRNA G527 N7-methylase RsmG